MRSKNDPIKFEKPVDQLVEDVFEKEEEEESEEDLEKEEEKIIVKPAKPRGGNK